MHDELYGTLTLGYIGGLTDRAECSEHGPKAMKNKSKGK